MNDLLKDNEALENFLKKVDDIESIVKSLKSDDPNVVNESMHKADQLLGKLRLNIEDDDIVECEGYKTKTIENRTLINKTTKNSSANQTKFSANQSQEAFLKSMEQDANERYERRMKNKKISNEFKDSGNKEFSNGNYDKAIELYTQALDKLKDNLPVYTNRAQAYIKIGKYNEAISDCEWAIRIDEKCIKAYIHKGRAFTYLKEFDKAIEQFKKAKEIDQKQVAIVEEYIKEVERCRHVHEQEKNVEKFVASDGDTVIKIIENIYKLNQHLNYYSGGLVALASCLNDENQKTLFRLKNGFQIFDNHSSISKCFLSQNYDKMDKDEIEVLCSAFELLKSACNDCDENIKCLFKIRDISTIITNILNNNTKLQENLKLEVAELLFKLSSNEYGIQMMIDNFDNSKLIVSIIEFAGKYESKNLSFELLTAQIAQNLSADKKFHLKLKNSNESISQIFLKITTNLKKDISIEIKTILLLITNNLLTNESIKNQIIENEDIWISLENLFGKNEDHTKILLSIFINLCARKSEPLNSHGKKIIKLAYNENYRYEDKSLMLIGNIIQNCKDSQKELKMNELLIKLIKNIKDEKLVKLSIKILALFTEREIEARKLVLNLEKNMDFLYNLFKDCSNNQSESNKKFRENEILINNCCLCLSHLVEHDKSIADYFTKTNIIMDLLYLTRDLYKNEAQKNCAILIAKLVKQNEKHLLRLRELNGIEIIHSSLKNIQF